jgi:serine/threonine-protein kinase
MAPEQVLGRPLTPQADIYAYGILLFELLSGMKPVAGDSVEQIFQHILYEPLNLDPLKAAKVPASVCDLVARCSAKQIVQRPQSLGQVCDELEHVLDPSRPAPPKLPVPAAGPPPPAPPKPGPKPAAGVGAGMQPYVPVRARESADGVPAFLAWLPESLQTQTGVMLLAGSAVILVVLLLYALLSAVKVI